MSKRSKTILLIAIAALALSLAATFTGVTLAWLLGDEINPNIGYTAEGGKTEKPIETIEYKGYEAK